MTDIVFDRPSPKYEKDKAVNDQAAVHRLGSRMERAIRAGLLSLRRRSSFGPFRGQVLKFLLIDVEAWEVHTSL